MATPASAPVADGPSRLLRLPDKIWRNILTYVTPVNIYGAVSLSSNRLRAVAETLPRNILVNIIITSSTSQAPPPPEKKSAEEQAPTTPTPVRMPPDIEEKEKSSTSAPAISAPSTIPVKASLLPRVLRIPTPNGHCSCTLPEASAFWVPVNTETQLVVAAEGVENRKQLQAGEVINLTVPLSDLPVRREDMVTLLRTWISSLQAALGAQPISVQAAVPQALNTTDGAAATNGSHGTPPPPQFSDRVLASPVGRIPPLTLVPWEIRINPRRWTESSAVHLRDVLATLTARVITAYYPPSTIVRLLPPSTQVLRLEYVSDGLDFAGIEKLSGLTRMDLEGPPGGLMYNNEPPEDIFPENLRSLASLAPSLQDLRIGRWFPLTDYTPFCADTLIHLHNLRNVYTRGLFQGDQPASLLAKLVASWTLLTEFHYLADVDEEFWRHLETELEKKGRKTLDHVVTFTLEFSSEDPGMGVIYAAREAIAKFFPNIYLTRILFTNLGESAGRTEEIHVASLIDAMGRYLDKVFGGKEVWTLFFGVKVKLEEMALWGDFNLNHGAKVGFRPPKSDYLLRLDDGIREEFKA